MTDDAYTTIARAGRAETRVLGSRFLALASPARTPGEAIGRWKEIRREYHDATHHCFAYRLGPGGGEFRSSDDGEPTGTAGRPILAVIDRRGLTDVLVVVVRWFGGTKLGVGPLARAYRDAAEAALEAVPAERRLTQAVLHVAFAHELTPGIMRAAEAAGAQITGSRYDDDAHLDLSVRSSGASALRAALVEATRGRVRFESREEPPA
jgi:uncharacterized YigZ family protein